MQRVPYKLHTAGDPADTPAACSRIGFAMPVLDVASAGLHTEQIDRRQTQERATDSLRTL